MSDTLNNLKIRLEQYYQFPTEYTYKFIVPAAKADLIVELFKDKKYSVKNSKSGKFLSLTSIQNESSANNIIQVYQKVMAIEGAICL